MPENVKTLKGHLLLDSGQLSGSFFHRTVILICQHDPEGAFGLVLNRFSGNKVGDALVADLPERIKEQPLFLGGPVQPTALSYLHSDEYLPEANVMANLKLAHSLEELVDLAESFSGGQKIRIFVGYAGWSAGQIEEEIKRGAWILHEATLESVFHEDPKALWRQILRQKGGKYRMIAQMPDDLSWN